MSSATLTSPNETAYQLINRDYLSFSAISLYRRCPFGSVGGTHF